MTRTQGATLEQQGKHAADSFRQAHHLGVGPLSDLVGLVEQTTGCEVAILDAHADEHGLTMRDPERGVTFIGIARSRNPMRQRSTLAHELAHLIFTDWTTAEDLSARSPHEIRADAFARHLLVPGGGLAEFLGDRGAVTEADLSTVVQRFLVSPAIAAIALHDRGYIDAATKSDWMQYPTRRLATRYGWTDYYLALQDDSNRLRSPQRLLARAIRGYGEGVVSAQTIATLRSISVEVVIDELSEAGVVPAEHAEPDLPADDLPDVEVDLSDLDDGEDSPP